MTRMAKYENKGINSLLTLNWDSVSSGFDLNELRAVFDSNFERWESIPPGDPERRKLAEENEKILGLILNRCYG